MSPESIVSSVFGKVAFGELFLALLILAFGRLRRSFLSDSSAPPSADALVTLSSFSFGLRLVGLIDHLENLQKISNLAAELLLIFRERLRAVLSSLPPRASITGRQTSTSPFVDGGGGRPVKRSRMSSASASSSGASARSLTDLETAMAVLVFKTRGQIARPCRACAPTRALRRGRVRLLRIRRAPGQPAARCGDEFLASWHPMRSAKLSAHPRASAISLADGARGGSGICTDLPATSPLPGRNRPRLRCRRRWRAQSVRGRASAARMALRGVWWWAWTANLMAAFSSARRWPCFPATLRRSSADRIRQPAAFRDRHTC